MKLRLPKSLSFLPEESDAALFFPAGWQGPDHPVAWITEAGTPGEGLLADLPPMKAPRLVIGWPTVCWSSSKLPPGLHDHPQALATAMEDSLLTPPEDAFVCFSHQDAGAAVFAITDRKRLRKFLNCLETHQIHPVRAVPEAWLDSVGKAVLGDGGGWVHGRDGLPIMLDAWTPTAPPLVLRLLVQRGELDQVNLYWNGRASSLDLASWQQQMGCPVQVAGHWDWTVALSGERPDLLRFEFRVRTSALRAILPTLKPMALGLAALALLELGMSLADWGRLAWRHRELSAALEANYRSAFPGNDPLLAPMLQASRALGDLHRKAGEWGDDDFVPLATRALPLLKLVPEGKLKALSYENRSLMVEAEGQISDMKRIPILARSAGLTASQGQDGRLRITSGVAE